MVAGYDCIRVMHILSKRYELLVSVELNAFSKMDNVHTSESTYNVWVKHIKNIFSWIITGVSSILWLYILSLTSLFVCIASVYC